MKPLHIKSLAFGALLSAVFIFTVAAVQEQRAAWEYKAYHQGTSSSLDMNAINNMGNEGWEAVSFFSLEHSKGFLFKRKK